MLTLFAILDHKDPYTHLTKFYKFVGTLGAPEVEEKTMFMRLFLNWLIGKENEWYLLQLTQVMTNWNILEEKFINWFFPQNKFISTKSYVKNGKDTFIC